MQFDAFGDEQAFLFGQLDILQHADQVGFSLDQLLHGCGLGTIERATGTGHAVLALCPEGVGTIPMPQVVVLPHLTSCCCTGQDGLLVEQDFNGREILFQVACLDHATGEFGRVDLGVMLGGGQVLVPEVLFEFKEGERLVEST